MAKTFDPMAAALGIKRRQQKLADVPEKHRRDVVKLLTSQEGKLIMHARELSKGPSHADRMRPTHVRNVISR